MIIKLVTYWKKGDLRSRTRGAEISVNTFNWGHIYSRDFLSLILLHKNNTTKHTKKIIIDAAQKETAIDQQQHSCETLIYQRHKTILRFLSTAAMTRTWWRVLELYCQNFAVVRLHICFRLHRCLESWASDVQVLLFVVVIFWVMKREEKVTPITKKKKKRKKKKENRGF
jgi:hypothetical protein